MESDADTAFIGIAGVACSAALSSSPLSSPEEAGVSDSHGSTPDEAGASVLGERDATGMAPVSVGRAEGICPVAGNSVSSAGSDGASALVRADARD